MSLLIKVHPYVVDVTLNPVLPGLKAAEQSYPGISDAKFPDVERGINSNHS